MELVELLDKIDIHTPKGCRTCKFMATHENCDGCLGQKKSNTPRAFDFHYYNWEPGNWLRELYKAQREGRKNIVIGGQGEADFCSLSTPQSVCRHLKSIANECGYMVGHLTGKNTPELSLTVCTHDGSFNVVWRAKDDYLLRIEDISGDVVTISWPEPGLEP